MGLSADEPAWAPGGTQLLFTSNVTQVAGTWLMNADGSGQRFVTTNAADTAAAFPGDAAWQPLTGTATATTTAQAAVSSGASPTSASLSIQPVTSSDATLRTAFQNVMGRAPGTAELVGMREVLATSSLSSLTQALTIMGSNAACALTAAPLGDAVLTATASPDLFVFGDIAFGNDTIIGFDPTRDTIRIVDNPFADPQTLRNAATDVAGGTLITLGTNQSITIKGIASSSLAAGNLIIG